MLRNPVSKRNIISISLVLLALAAMTLALKPRAAQAYEGDERSGFLHVTKECSAYTGAAGSFCTFTSSNLEEIAVGSKIFYTLAPVGSTTPEGNVIGLDSDTVLYVGTGNWAVGHCTLDGTGNVGVCTFSGGTGLFTGFRARVDVSSPDGVNYYWNGTYSFSSDHK